MQFFHPPDVVASQSLHDQLTTAIRAKNPQALEKLINIAEVAEYPELSSVLRKARGTLESLGGGRGGQLSKVVSKYLPFINRRFESDLMYLYGFTYSLAVYFRVSLYATFLRCSLIKWHAKQ